VAAIPQRSPFVTVIAWIFIALSGFGLAISLLQNVLIHAILRSPGFEGALEAPTDGVPPVVAYLFGHLELVAFASLLVMALVFVSSIGLLRRWNWARLCFAGLMILAVAWQLAGIALQFFLFPFMRSQLAAAAAHGDGPDIGPFFIGVYVVSVLFALGFGVLFGWIAMKLLSRPIAAEFQPRGQ
jgi:hypothetical protein